MITVDAPNNQQKSPKRQQCEQNAVAKAQAATDAIRGSFWSDVKLGAVVGGLFSAAYGCAGGAIVGSAIPGPGTVAGCLIGAGAAIPEGVAGGIATTALFDGVRSYQATATLKQDMAVCSTY
jgi:hypothetical protein